MKINHASKLIIVYKVTIMLQYLNLDLKLLLVKDHQPLVTSYHYFVFYAKTNSFYKYDILL